MPGVAPNLHPDSYLNATEFRVMDTEGNVTRWRASGIRVYLENGQVIIDLGLTWELERIRYNKPEKGKTLEQIGY